MAQRVNVVLVDDIDGTDADETVRFGIDGAEYDIELSAGNAKRLREILAPYTDAGRRAAGNRRGGRRRAGGTPASEIREWARANGWDVPDRGRVASEVREAYTAAH